VKAPIEGGRRNLWTVPHGLSQREDKACPGAAKIQLYINDSFVKQTTRTTRWQAWQHGGD